jgi:N-acetylglucosaminyldiphosphoundecaprenol N-acetyl-beta-D-mannosaminyltransferase
MRTTPHILELPKAAAQRLSSSAPSSETSFKRISLGNFGIDTYSEIALADHVLDHAFNGTKTRQIVTANAQFYVLAENDERFRRCLEHAEYVCADGAPIVWACNRFAGSLVPRIAGVDFIQTLCERGMRDGLRVFFLGGRPGTAALAAASLQAKYPGMQIAGVSCPDWGFEKQAKTLDPVLAQIATAKPHLLLVGLGAPKQEFFIDEHIRSLHVPIAIGIGGSFEILSGSVQRAPGWIQSRGFEWAFRLMQEPRRLWKRYLLGNAAFVWDLMKWRLRVLRSTSAIREPLKES